MKEIIGIIAVLLVFAALVPYVRDMLRGKTKPHLFSLLIWGIVTAIAFFGQAAAGGGPGSWTTGVMAAMTFITIALAFKYGTKDITKSDVVFFVAGLLTIVPWYLTNDPTISVVLATLIDVFGFAPTKRKTIKDSTSETLISWVINLARHALSITALSAYSIATVAYPGALVIMNAIVVYVIVSGRRNGARQERAEEIPR